MGETATAGAGRSAAAPLAFWSPPPRAGAAELDGSLREALAAAAARPLLLVRTELADAGRVARTFEACVPCRSADGPVGVAVLLAGLDAPGGAHGAFVLRRALGALGVAFCIAAVPEALLPWIAARVPRALAGAADRLGLGAAATRWAA